MSKLRVLMYHKVSENQTDYLTVTVEQLKQQLLWLKQRFTFITLRELTEHIQNAKSLPENAILITFDDGYENNFALAYPLFKQLNLPFSIFLVSDFIGKEVEYDNQLQSFLTIEQLQKMQELVQYGMHSFSHNSLMDLTDEQWSEEIKKGKESLNKLPITIENIWAYTYGSFPKRNPVRFNSLKEIFKLNVIHGAFRIGNRKNRLPLIEPYAIQRIDIRGNESFFKFKWKVLIGRRL